MKELEATHQLQSGILQMWDELPTYSHTFFHHGERESDFVQGKIVRTPSRRSTRSGRTNGIGKRDSKKKGESPEYFLEDQKMAKVIVWSHLEKYIGGHHHENETRGRPRPLEVWGERERGKTLKDSARYANGQKETPGRSAREGALLSH